MNREAADAKRLGVDSPEQDVIDRALEFLEPDLSCDKLDVIRKRIREKDVNPVCRLCHGTGIQKGPVDREGTQLSRWCPECFADILGGIIG